MALAEPFAVDHPFMPPDTFKDDVILVTGGGTGLGKAMAQMFARHGGRIAIASRKEEHRAAGVAAIEALGGTAIGVALDIRDPEQVTRAFDEIEASLGPVTILINNAAGASWHPPRTLRPMVGGRLHRSFSTVPFSVRRSCIVAGWPQGAPAPS